jgi:anti-anti-sigma factor
MTGEKPTVLITLNPTFGGGRVVVSHLDHQGRETEVARFVSGRWPGQQPPDISETVRNETAAGNRDFIIDLSQARWLNSRGIGYLASLWASITRAGGVPVLINASHRLMALLRVTKLDTVFRLADSLEAARTCFRSGDSHETGHDE